jgi:hypothetical protein
VTSCPKVRHAFIADVKKLIRPVMLDALSKDLLFELVSSPFLATAMYRLPNDILCHSSASREIANHSIQKWKLLNDTIGEFFFVGHQLLAPLNERSVEVTCTQRSSLRGSRVTAHARYLHSFLPGGHKLADLGVIRVLFAAILALGVVIIRKRSAHIVAEFNSDRRTAVRTVQGSFFFDHQSPASFSLAIHFGPSSRAS